MRKGQIVYEWDVMRHPALGSDFALPMTPAPSLAEPMEIQAHPIPLEDQPHRQLQVEGAPEAAQDPPLFDTARLSDPLPFGMYEIWVIMEFADKGSLEDHIAKKRLVRLADGSPDRVSSSVSVSKPAPVTTA